MNLRQGVLVTSFCTTLFLNFASTYWTMWSVATMSLFVIMITDFMFFEVIDCCCFHPAERLAPRVRSLASPPNQPPQARCPPNSRKFMLRCKREGPVCV